MAKWITTADMKVGDIVFGVEPDFSITKYKVLGRLGDDTEAEVLHSTYYTDEVQTIAQISDIFCFYTNYWDAYADSIKGITGSELYRAEFGP